MRLIHSLTAAMLCSLVVASSAVALTPAERQKHFDLDKKHLALKGYDPVAYHAHDGKQGKATKGDKKYQLTHEGVLYYFSSKANKDRFIANPEAYEPAYGGWCAWAMLDGGKTSADPKTYRLIDNKLYVFYNGVWGNTSKDWDKRAAKNTGEQAKMVKEADGQWQKITKK